MGALRGLLERTDRGECTSARYEVAWSDRDSDPASQQADPRQAVVEYAKARIGEDLGVRDGPDIRSLGWPPVELGSVPVTAAPSFPLVLCLIF